MPTQHGTREAVEAGCCCPDCVAVRNPEWFTRGNRDTNTYCDSVNSSYQRCSRPPVHTGDHLWHLMGIFWPKTEAELLTEENKRLKDALYELNECFSHEVIGYDDGDITVGELIAKALNPDETNTPSPRPISTPRLRLPND